MFQSQRIKELEAFEDTKAGVKGLIDSGVQKIPSIFYHDNINLFNTTTSSQSEIPIIDLSGISGASRFEIINKIRDASENWGFFQIINHGIPRNVMEEVINGVRGFHELDFEVKEKFYSRDHNKSFKYNSNFDLFQGPRTNWRDTLECNIAPIPPNPQNIPHICRFVIIFFFFFNCFWFWFLFCFVLFFIFGLRINNSQRIEVMRTTYLLGGSS